MRSFATIIFALPCGVAIACGGAETLVPPPSPAVAAITIRAVPDTLRQMHAVQMLATATGTGGQSLPGASITWSSIDERVATIDQRGLLLPRKPGTARIVARSGDVSDTTRVTVSMRWLDVAISQWSGGCGVGGDSTAYCWGATDLLGRASEALRPVEVPGGHAFRAIAVGSSVACALTATGDAYCWGKNDSGQLGAGEGPASSVPVRVKSNGIAFTQLSSNGGYTCAVATTGVVHCWGSNSWGQLGSEGTPNVSVPTVVPGAPRAAKVAAGAATACALIVDERVFCWGNNFWGQAGRGAVSWFVSAGPIASERAFRDVAISLDGGCAIATTGGAYCWGDHRGDLSNASPVLMPGTTDFRSVAAAEWNRCGLTPAGAKCWGSMFTGELGSGDATPSLGPQLVPNSADFIKLTFGFSAACALTSTGGAYCWGDNGFGQLGDGTTTSRNRPTKVLDPIT